MRVLITGASGLLGRPLMREFEGNDSYEVLGTALSRASGNLHKLDLLDDGAVEKLVHEYKPDVIIHSAAERRPDVSQNDPDETLRLNIDATKKLAELAAENNSWILYLSTDYVFDGTKAPYKTSDETNPLNFYGKSKRDGENAIWSVSQDACVLRVPILYGQVETLDESAITVIAKNILESNGEPIEFDHWATRYPTLVDDVASVIRQILIHKKVHPEFKGTLHWSGDEPYTKYEMAQVIARVWEISAEHMTPDSGPPSGTPRPKNCHLDCSDLEGLGIGKRTQFETAISDIIKSFRR